MEKTERTAESFISGIRRRGILAFALLCGLLLVNTLLLELVIGRVQGDYEAMNLLGRQHMLTERTAVIARYLVRTNDAEERERTREVLFRGAELLQENQLKILSQIETRHFNGLVGEVRDIFFRPPFLLERKMREYIGRLELLASADPEDLNRTNPYYQSISDAAGSGELLKALSFASSKYREESRDGVGKLLWLTRLILGLNVFMLAAIGFFVIMPVIRKVKEETGKLARANRELRLRASELERSRIAALNIMQDARAARRAAEEAEDRLRLIIDSSPNAVFLVSPDFRIVMTNERAVLLSGFPKEGLLRKSFWGLVAPEEKRWLEPMLNLYLDKSAGSAEPLNCEVSLSRSNEETFPAELTIGAMKMDNRIFLLAFLTDITERRRLEKIRASEERFRGVIQQAAEALFLVESTGEFAEVNDKACESVGYSREELLSLGIWDINPAYTEKAYATLFNHLKQTRSLTMEGMHRRRDGTLFPVEIHAGLIELHGRPYLLSFARDITERKRAEHEVREMSLALRNAVEGISRLDEQGRFTMMNKSFTDMFGYTGTEITGMEMREFIVVDDRETFREAFRKMKTAGKADVDVRGMHRDGSVFNLHLSLVKTRGEDSDFTGYYCFTKDITEQKYKEALEIKSELISMVAHELRTPLHSVREGISVMLEGLTGDINDEQKDVLTTTKSSLDRLVRLVNSVLDFQRLEAGIVEFQVEKCDVNELVREAWKSCEPLIYSKKLQGRLELEHSMPEAECDRDRITQVLINLINNAVKFTDAGSISVASRREGHGIRIVITDTGIGIKPEDVPRLFRKFGQLESGKFMAPGGAGLGLIISKKIIEEHGGHINVESRYREGSSFSFFLPFAPVLASGTWGAGYEEKNIGR